MKRRNLALLLALFLCLAGCTPAEETSSQPSSAASDNAWNSGDYHTNVLKEETEWPDRPVEDGVSSFGELVQNTAGTPFTSDFYVDLQPGDEAVFLHFVLPEESAAEINYTVTTDGRAGVVMGCRTAGGEPVTWELPAAPVTDYGSVWQSEGITLPPGLTEFYLTGDGDRCRMSFELTIQREAEPAAAASGEDVAAMVQQVEDILAEIQSQIDAAEAGSNETGRPVDLKQLQQELEEQQAEIQRMMDEVEREAASIREEADGAVQTPSAAGRMEEIRQQAEEARAEIDRMMSDVQAKMAAVQG